MSINELLIIFAVIVSIMIGVALCIFITGFFFFKSKNDKSKNIDSVDIKVPLNRIINYKVEMDKEKRINHEYEPGTDFLQKLYIGTDELNNYKTNHSCSISDIYEVR